MLASPAHLIAGISFIEKVKSVPSAVNLTLSVLSIKATNLSIASDIFE